MAPARASRLLYLLVSFLFIIVMIAANSSRRAGAEAYGTNGIGLPGNGVADAVIGEMPEFPGAALIPAREETRSVEFGQAPADFFRSFGFSGSEIAGAVGALSDVLDMTRIKAGQEMTVEFGTNGRPRAILVPVAFNKVLEVRKSGGRWTSGERWLDFRAVDVLRTTSVETSLYQAAEDAGIPLAVMMEAIGLFSFRVDFQRDIHSGNGVTVLYEQLTDEDGAAVAPGELLYARLDLEGRSVEAWRYERLDGTVDYYEADGTSVRKALLKTPVDGGRLTSGFGYRKHPILGYTALHRGVDFAVPIGTPVMAAGDGRVIRAGWHDQYGYHVLVRHANHYDTLYGHFSAIARGIAVGTQVEQGMVVGFVGSTGMSTGPHCHYEVRYYGSPVNPSTLKFPPRHELAGEDSRLFALERDALLSEFDLHGAG